MMCFEGDHVNESCFLSHTESTSNSISLVQSTLFRVFIGFLSQCFINHDEPLLYLVYMSVVQQPLYDLHDTANELW